jgi:hypothetical protein
LLLPVVAAVLCSGCGALVRWDADPAGPPEPLYGVGGAPEGIAGLGERLPAAIRTTHARGFIWLGYNVSAVQGRDINEYDSGEGPAFGAGFGNGMDVKHFVEFGFERSDRHALHDTTGAEIGGASHRRFYLGKRHYLLPVTEHRGRVVSFVSAGLTWNRLGSSMPVTVAGEVVEDATGLGIYAGTGLELYTGGQTSIAMDLRGSYWDWEGKPEGTGDQITLSTSVSFVLHF